MSRGVPGRFVAVSVGALVLGPPLGLFVVLGSGELFGFDGEGWAMPVIGYGVWVVHVGLLAACVRRWRRGELVLSVGSADARALVAWATLVACGVVFAALSLAS